MALIHHMRPIAAWLSLNILTFGLGCALGLALSVALLRLLEEQQGLARALQGDAADADLAALARFMEATDAGW